MAAYLSAVFARSLCAATCALALTSSTLCLAQQPPAGTQPATTTPSQPTPRLEIAFATYLGGSHGEQAREVIRLPDGSLLIGGQTASDDFPVTSGVVQPEYGGEPAGSGHPGLVSGDCYLSILSADGRRLLASTFFGGSKQERNVYGMDVDSHGDIVITSLSRSNDLPVTKGAFQSTNHGGPADMFAAKISGDLKTLRWCTYFGGSGDETPRGGLALDSHDNVYLVGTTTSRDFPTTPGTLQTKLKDGRSTAVVKLKPDGSLAWSTLIGGSEHADTPHADIMGARVGKDGTIHLVGHTNAKDFPVTADAPQKTLAGQTDLFFAGLSADGKRLLYSTYWGGSRHEFAEHRMALLRDGAVIADGFTDSADFPVTKGAYQASLKGEGGGCLVKLAGDHRTVAFSTYLGGSGDTNLLQPTVDKQGNIWLVGYTSSRDFPVTADALQKTHGGGKNDGVVAVFSADGSRLLYATFLGGSGDDGVRGMTLGPAGEVDLVGETTSPDFPATRNAFQPKPGGENDGFVVRLRLVVKDSTSQPADTSARDIDSLSARIEQLINDIKTLQTTVTTTTVRNGQRETESSTDSYARQPDGSVLFRRERTVDNPRAANAPRSICSIFDGRLLHTVEQIAGKTVVFRAKISPRLQATPLNRSPFEPLRSWCHMRVLPEEKLDGKAVWVVEAVDINIANAGTDEPVRMLIYIDQLTGIGLKSVGWNKAGDITEASLTTDSKVNIPISLERFQYRPGPDVQVEDIPFVLGTQPASTGPASQSSGESPPL